MKNKLMKFNATRYILLGFMIVILIGSLLLSLPISSASGEAVPYIDALFTATSMTCVTGIATISTFSTWSLFGKIVILCLLQVGGLGIITIMAGFMIFLNKRFGLKDYLLIQDTFNLNTMSGLKEFVKKVIFGTFCVEILGALLYMIAFVPEYGTQGIWLSIFTSISAFCNSGVDIISEQGLVPYALNPIVMITTCLLVVAGSLGFIVWWDILRIIKQKKSVKSLTLHSKIVLSTTLILIILGALGTFLAEYNNPLTISEMSLFEKIGVSIAHSIIVRTAAFPVIPHSDLTNAGTLIALMLMFIGGSPAGTAGGIKTVTIAILVVTMMSMVKNKNEVSMFGRKVSHNDLRKSIVMILSTLGIFFVSTFLLAMVTDVAFLDIICETMGATTTVGFTRGLTPLLNTWGKIIIMTTMYLGRIGPVSLMLALNTKRKNANVIKHPVEEITIG